MVLNALGFTSRALYLTPEYFANKPLDVLIRDGVTAADLNDDSLGRALDTLYERGVTEMFAQVASHALGVCCINSRFHHLDSTSFSVEGTYATPSEDPQEVVITHGYSKDHRPDLKLLRRKPSGVGELTGQTVPNQVGKPTTRPTMRWVFQLFEGIDLLLVSTETDEKRMVLNLKPIHRQILKLLGPQVQKCYFCDS